MAWIVLSLLFLILGMQLFSSMAGFETVPTSTTLEQLRGDAKLKVLAANRKWSTEYRAALRSEMIEAYGGSCSCCGEIQPKFLQLDHIENDGHLDRKIHRTSTKLFAHLKKAGWPKDRYQLLCANCNFGKLLNGGTCPHKGSSHA